MLRSLRVSCAVTAIALSVVGPGALTAAGDDGPRPPFPSDRPTRSILRPTEIASPAPKPSDKEIILLVSGIGSDAPDGTFDKLIEALSKDPRYEIHRFGGDPAYPYDTHGSVGANAERLTEEIRALGATHPSIHIVAHSMGGAVADAAFANGLSARDKVVSYISLASPHNGSSGAATSQAWLPFAGLFGAGTEMRAISAGFAQDIGSRAVADLAVVRAGPPPPGVVRLDLRMVTDLIVTAPDAWAPGVTRRTLLPTTIESLEGHGGVTTDPRAIALVTSTLAAGRPPELDPRARVLDFVAFIASSALVESNLHLYAGICAAAFCGAIALSLYRRRKSLLLLGWLP
ncbi:MAG TPA: hypothetical protein VGA38_04320 [Candidatus Limnocylindria bacterium]